MFEKPSLVTRVAVGKLAGFAVGQAGFQLVPVLVPESGWMIRWGILLWYTTLGAIVGMFGVFTYRPVLKLPMPWWLLAPSLGAWMNFVLTLFAYDIVKDMMVVIFGVDGILTSPFWFVLEGALVGLLIGYLATRFGGEGPETVGR